MNRKIGLELEVLPNTLAVRRFSLPMYCVLIAAIGLMHLGTAFAIDKMLPTSTEQIHPLLIGQDIPSVSITSIEGKKIELTKLISQKSTVLVFYRGGWCPYCNIQLKALKEVEQQLLNLGFQIIAVSTDRVEELKSTLEKHKLSYKLFSDSTSEAAKAFGIAFKVDDQTLVKYKGFGIDVEKASGNANHILPVPSVFIVNQKGEIQFEYINPNYKVRLSGDVLLAAAKAARASSRKN